VVRGAPTRAASPAKADASPPQPRDDRPRAHRGGRRTSSESGLTREAIVDAAIAIADAEGIDGLSMRRVATELRVSAMALYRHVAGKEELVTAMIDKIYRESDLPERPPDDWRQALRLAMRWEWGAYRAHPWAIRFTPMGGSVRAPALAANADWMMRVITARGHSADTATAVVTFLSAYTSGMCLQASQAVVEEHDFGMDAEHWWRSKGPEFVKLAAEGRYPVLFSASGPPSVDRIFDLGMEHLLDGLAPLIAPEE
jgi:AcrR family transcriptional regulator